MPHSAPQIVDQFIAITKPPIINRRMWSQLASRGGLLKLKWMIGVRYDATPVAVFRPYTNYYTPRWRSICRVPPPRWGLWSSSCTEAGAADNASIRLRTALNYCHLGEPSVLSAGRLGCENAMETGSDPSLVTLWRSRLIYSSLFTVV